MLGLDDRAAIEALLGTDGQAPSEYCFANLYLFQKRHQYRLLEDPVPYLSGITYDGVHHAMPLVPFDADLIKALEASGIACIYPLGPQASQLPVSPSWQWHHVDADSDYWFDAAAMADMRFSKDRRHVARAFAAEHQPSFETWRPSIAPEALEVLDGWFADVSRSAEATDLAECREAIRLAAALGLEGGLVRTKTGVPVAFLLASPRKNGVYVVHFAKGRRTYPGAYPWMFAHFGGSSGARYLNFEQDLGNPGLAQSKRAYAPIERRPKLRLIRRGQ